MKTLLVTFLSLLSLHAFAANSTIAYYHIERGALHTGGKASVQVMQSDDTVYRVLLNYEIFKKILVPIPEDALKGETIVDLPPQFGSELGYLELEAKGVMQIENAKLQFVKRVKWKNLKDAYQLLILPNNGRSKIDVIYHPSVASAGWPRLVVTFISKVPILNGYQAAIEINE